MRFATRRLALMAGAALAASISTAALAQDPGPPPGPPPMMDEGPGGPPPMFHHRFDPEAHAQHLRDVLQLRPDQDGALKAYLAAIAPPRPAEGERRARPASEAPLTTPQRLDREAERLARFSEAFKARAAATRTFYAALSPSQQKAFDALGPMAGGRGPMMRRAEFRRAWSGPKPGGAKKED
ncbi:MAG: Spy/CpxP family protein refolding chaperone [Caulobacter sp.]|nr:Spy/CpxP family protein refolding chaperone [Caulobacter sp.]